MPFRVACPTCGSKGTAPDKAAGREVKCPKCRATIRIPSIPGTSGATSFRPTPETSSALPKKPKSALPEREEIPSVLPVEEPEDVIPVSEEECDVVELVEDAAPATPAPPRARARSGTALPSLKEILIKGRPGASGGRSEYDLLNPTTNVRVGTAYEESTASLMIVGSGTGRSSTIEVFQGEAEDLVFTMLRPARFMGHPKAEVRNAQEQTIGFIHSTAVVGIALEICDRHNPRFADARSEGKPSKWKFRTKDRQELGFVTLMATRRPGSLIQSAVAGTFNVAFGEVSTQSPEYKFLLLGAAFFIDLLFRDRWTAMGPR